MAIIVCLHIQFFRFILSAIPDSFQKVWHHKCMANVGKIQIHGAYFKVVTVTKPTFGDKSGIQSPGLFLLLFFLISEAKDINKYPLGFLDSWYRCPPLRRGYVHTFAYYGNQWELILQTPKDAMRIPLLLGQSLIFSRFSVPKKVVLAIFMWGYQKDLATVGVHDPFMPFSKPHPASNLVLLS